MKQIQCINTNIAGRTTKQYREDNQEKVIKWRQDNVEKINEYHLQYRQDNKEKLKNYFEQYRQDNKQKIKEYRSQKIQCEICGKFITRSNISQHKKNTNKCQKIKLNLENNM